MLRRYALRKIFAFRYDKAVDVLPSDFEPMILILQSRRFEAFMLFIDEMYDRLYQHFSVLNPSLPKEDVLIMCSERIDSEFQRLNQKVDFSSELGNFYFSYVKRILTSVSSYKMNLHKLKCKINSLDHPTFSKFPVDQIWRLFIDANRNPTHCYFFDVSDHCWSKEDTSEQGYIAGLINAFSLHLPENGERLNISKKFLCDLHKFAVSDVRKVSKNFETGFVFSNHFFGLIEGENMSLDGIEELKLKVKDPDSLLGGLLTVSPGQYAPYVLETDFDDVLLFHSKLRVYLNEFKVRFEQCHSADEKQREMVRLVQDLDQLHPFSDGNIRTFGFLLLNLLLFQEKLPLVIWDDPNVLDAHSLDECCQLVKEGQRRYLSMIH